MIREVITMMGPKTVIRPPSETALPISLILGNAKRA